MNQQIRFCKSFDGTSIAYAVTGKGPALVKAQHWLTHLEYEARSPIWKPWIEALSKGRSLLRIDQRGCGLSDQHVRHLSMDTWLRDLDAAVNAAGLDRFALFGHSQGGAIAVQYAAAHPERVTHLVLLGAYARGRLKRDVTAETVAELEAQLKLIEVGWGRDDPSYRQMFASQFIPGGTLEQMNSMSELQRISATPENAVAIIRTLFSIDVREAAARVTCPTLILQARGDRRSPFEEARLLAGLIPEARMVTLDTSNHILLEQEPAFRQFFEELELFLPRAPGAGGRRSFEQLTVREGEILDHIAQGLDNAQIAARLDMSEKTVRNHITHIFDKLAVENRSQAIVMAREAGLGQKSRPS